MFLCWYTLLLQGAQTSQVFTEFLYRSFPDCISLLYFFENTTSLYVHFNIYFDKFSAKISSISSVQSLSPVQLFATPWTAACQAFLSITNSRSLLKLMSIESVMPSNYLILCRPLLPPSIFPSIRVFSSESVGRNYTQ